MFINGEFRCLYKLLLIVSIVFEFQIINGEQVEVPLNNEVVDILSDVFSENNEDTKPYFVMFYAPWCGHCKRLHPTWDLLGEKFNEKDNQVTIGKVDCTEQTALCASQDINGYPTLKYLSGKNKNGVKYKGPRDFDSLEKFLLSQVNEDSQEEDEEYENVPKPVSGLVEYTDETFSKAIKTGPHFIKFYAPWCGHCQTLAPVWELLSKSFEQEKSVVTIGKLDCTQYRTTCAEFEVKGYPTLLWIEDGKKTAKYAGDRSLEDLKRFVTEHLGDRAKQDIFEERPSAADKYVVALTGENYKNAIEKGVTLIKFYAPWCGHCKRMAPMYEELGKKFIGLTDVTIAKVDCTEDINREICSENKVDGFPTLLLFRNGQMILEYKGERSLEDLVDFVYDNLGHDEL